ncbi:hypothetical protein BCF33_0535 [Hasllibacter halocynthiae]|uniref:Uncharacterized protein n=1 Tax=Hasllibacter halocynthiae TaxID=595589 RepID=A0A2T0X7K4_9RHOB|nr:hypothetical protein [Hasllibacter halocynthiae]PRY94932.1 hypothetical protein BCF33_0535 [Hasllibacter halocynthiae]
MIHATPQAAATMARRARAARQPDDIVKVQRFGNYRLELRAIDLGDPHYRVDVFMDLHFLFEDGDGGTWTQTEKSNFASEFERVVGRVWNRRSIGATRGGARIEMRTRFKSRIGGVYPLDHWEVIVRKDADGLFEDPTGVTVRGFVYQGGRFGLGTGPMARNTVILTQHANAMRPTECGYQSTAAHEYGHMLMNTRTGREDEYAADHPNNADICSVMNAGNAVRGAHIAKVFLWAIGPADEHEASTGTLD